MSVELQVGLDVKPAPLNRDVKSAIDGIKPLIGNTPLLAIRFSYKGHVRTVYAKAEYFNFTGSIKDRMALHILEKAYQSGHLQPNARIIEATSGNTGIAIAGIGRALGHNVTIFMPDWMSTERIALIRSFGADIVLVSSGQGGFLGSIKMAKELADQEPNSFLPHQFSNYHNVEAHYRNTGPEILRQLQSLGLTPDGCVAGVGTGGTVMGIGKYLLEHNKNIKVYPLEPSNSPTLSTGHKVGKHRIQGISDEFIPPIVRLDKLNEVVGVDDGDAIRMAQKMSRTLGIGVGISSGANFLGAIKVQEMLGSDAVVVTVFSDDNKKYLSTGLMNEEPVSNSFISTEVELLCVNAIK